MPTVLISSRGTRLALSIAVIAATGVLTGCPPQPPPLSTTRPAVGDLAGQDAPSLGTQPVTGGIYVPLEDAAKPLDAAALEKARLDRASIYDHVKQKVAVPETRPAATQPVASAQSATTRPGEKSDDGTPPMAVKYYLQGRELFLQGANSEAMDRLEKALQLDPDAFTVLRLMGRVCFAASQLARGSMYLERAQRLRPQDVEANYLLGRYWLERKDYDRATYYLMQADDSPERLQTSTQTPLSAFYLARSYQAGGYHLAAAKEFERFITLASVPVPGYRYDRELSYLIDEEWTAALSAAENFVRVGEYVGALSHYQKAADAQPKDLFIASRQINALAHAGKLDAARERALTLVVSTNGGGEETIKLLAWTYRASGKEGQAIGDLRSRLAHSGGDDATLALTLSATQEYLGNREEAFATLRNYLREHPANMDVLKRLLKRVTTPEEFQAALAAAGAAVAADRSKHAEITREFISLTESSAGASFAKNAVPLKQGNFASEYLAALTARAHNAEPSVIDGYFQQSIKQAADFAPARDAYVAWLLGQERFTQATQIVQNAVSANPNDPATWQLLVQAEAAQQRYLSALQLAQDARRKFPGNAEVRLQLASVYRLRGQENEADAELTSLITEQPKNEQAYEALINAMLLRTRRPGTAGAGASQSSAVSVLAKMNRELPDSRYAQIHSAIFFARGGRLEEAELVLRRLQAESPEDPDVLIPLSQIRQLLGHTAEGIAILETAIKVHPDPDLVRALAALYREDEKPREALALTQRMMEQHPDVETYVVIHATELSAQDKPAEAIAVLSAGTKKFPRSESMALALARMQAQKDDDAGAAQTLQAFIKSNGETTERLYSLSHFYSAAGNEEAATATLQRILAIMPDHIGANNDLGYFWVDEGIKLADAEKMILKAIENEPNNPAFLDSLGWLYYKQGKFDQAVAALNKAISIPGGIEPEVLQHVGDSLYRVGKAAEAVERWRQAYDMLAGVDETKLTPHEKKQRDYLNKVIGSASRGGQPDLTPIAQSAPTTMPSNNGEANGTKAAGAVPSATLPQ